MDIIAYLTLAFCFTTILYLGYRNDFRRDRKEFINTVLGVLIIGSMYVILNQIEIKIPLWIWLAILIFFVGMKFFSKKMKNVEDEILENSDK